MSRKVGLGLLALAVAGLSVLPLLESTGARLAQAILTGLVPPALVLVALPEKRGAGPILAAMALLAASLAGSLALLVLLGASGPVESLLQASLAPIVMLAGLVVGPLLLMAWTWAVWGGGSRPREGRFRDRTPQR